MSHCSLSVFLLGQRARFEPFERLELLHVEIAAFKELRPVAGLVVFYLAFAAALTDCVAGLARRELAHLAL